MRQNLVTLLIGLILGVGAALGFGRDTDAGRDSPGSAGAVLDSGSALDVLRQIDELRDALSAERESRIELASQLASLRDELRGLTNGGVGAGPTPIDRGTGDSGGTAAALSARPRFDEAALVEAGFDRAEVSAYRTRLDEIELERLYLRDRATREGWLDSERYLEESRQLNGEITATRDEFGEDLVDWMLYTTGYPNRLRVVEVMDGSAADEAGLAAGDLIVRYDDRAVFSNAELRQGTTSGSEGESTPLEVMRDGRPSRVYVPRGPLGVRLAPAAVEPARAR